MSRPLTEWYGSARERGALAVAWAEVAGRDAWSFGPGIHNALGDVNACVLADAATRRRRLPTGIERSLPGVVRAYVDHLLLQMDDAAMPLTEQEIEAARAQTRPPIEWTEIEAARRSLEARP